MKNHDFHEALYVVIDQLNALQRERVELLEEETKLIEEKTKKLVK